MSRGEPFEYALIRVVPRVERGETMNVGVILYSLRPAFLGGRIELNEDRLRALDSAVDLAAVTAALAALDTECRRERPGGGARGARVRWLAAARGTLVQPRPVHRGLTPEPAAPV